MPEAMRVWLIRVTWQDGSSSMLRQQRSEAPPASGGEMSLPDPRAPGEEVRLRLAGAVSYVPPREGCAGIWEFEATEL
jgi:hypothetical protein